MATLINLSEEKFSFELIDYQIEHQGGAVINLAVELDFQEEIGEDDPFEYSDFIPIRDFVTDFLVNYPNETDFWEILNKNLVTSLISESIPTAFGTEYEWDEVVDSVTVDIDVQPGSSNINIPRSSTVTGIVEEEVIDLDESWSFAFEDYAIEHRGEAVIDLTVSYDYIDGIGIDDPFEYPEFIQIYNFIDEYLVNYPNETDFWEILNKNLVTSLLTEPIPTVFGIEYELDEVVDSLTVDIYVQPGSSGIDKARSSSVTGIPGRDQRVIGTKADDFLKGGKGDDRVVGRLGDDFLEGGQGNDRVVGGFGNDTLVGVDISSSKSLLGVGERDVMVGNRGFNTNGSDTFVLGNEAAVFYDDGDSSTRGKADHARILGFSPVDDIIQLHGNADLYDLEFSSSFYRTDAKIVYQPESQGVGEIIAKIIDVSPDLSLDDPAFTFV